MSNPKKVVSEYLKKAETVSDFFDLNELAYSLKSKWVRTFMFKGHLFQASGGSAETMGEYLFGKEAPWYEFACYEEGIKEELGFWRIRASWKVSGTSLVFDHLSSIKN